MPFFYHPAKNRGFSTPFARVIVGQRRSGSNSPSFLYIIDAQFIDPIFIGNLATHLLFNLKFRAEDEVDLRKNSQVRNDFVLLLKSVSSLQILY